MAQRRVASEAADTSWETAGRLEARAFARSHGGDVSVRELLVAGGLRGFTPEQLFPERAV